MQGLVHMSKSRNRSTCTPAPPHVAREMMHGLVHMYSCRPALCTPGWCTDLPSCTKVHLHRVVHLHSAHMSSWSQYAQVCKGRFLRRSNLARTPTVIVILSIRGNGKSWKLCALCSWWASLHWASYYILWIGPARRNQFEHCKVSHGPSKATFTITKPFQPNNNQCGPPHDKGLSPACTVPTNTNTNTNKNTNNNQCGGPHDKKLSPACTLVPTHHSRWPSPLPQLAGTRPLKIQQSHCMIITWVCEITLYRIPFW